MYQYYIRFYKEAESIVACRSQIPRSRYFLLARLIGLQGYLSRSHTISTEGILRKPCYPREPEVASDILF